MDPRMGFEDLKARREKWAYLTEGIGDDYRRIVCEILLENQERAIAQPGLFMETTTVNEVPTFTTFSFPLVRRVFPKLIANELVAVQPMSGPTGLIFYLDFKFGTTRSAVTAGDRVDQVHDDEYGNVGPGLTVPEINMVISQVTVTAEPRKLRSVWQIEAQQDLQSQYQLDAESELMAVQSQEIAREIDRDIIIDLVANATAGNVNWVKNVPGSGVYSTNDPQLYKNTLYHAIVDANDLIFAKRFRNASWIVAGPDFCSRLEKLENFKLMAGSDDATRNVGIIRFGDLANRWTVYKDPWFQTDKALIGYKGSSWMDTGYVYAPYIPVWVTPAFVNPETFVISRGMMSRYAKKVVVPDMYATITLTSS